MTWPYQPLLPSGQQLYVTITYAYARPDGDVSAGSWTDQTGSTANLYAVIDETSADDADYVKSSTLTSGSDTLEVSLSDINDPTTSTDHLVRYRYRRQGNSTAMTLTVSLRQGASQIASWTHTNVGTSYVTAEQTLSGAEADSITDYSDLRLRFVASA